MRASAAILTLSVFTCLHAHARGLKSLKTLENFANCGLTLGPVKCINILTAWRAEKALSHPNETVKFEIDLEQFPWRKYSNNTEEELYSKMCDGAEGLLRKWPLSLNMASGYRFELQSKGNGTLNVDIYKNAGSGRSSIKKATNKIYDIMPILVLPGLIMSAILPFLLPGLKIMTIAAGMINNMALTGAVFTLLRNNAFNDRYEHKIVYVNDGYKNEKFAHFAPHSHKNPFDINFAESKPQANYAVPNFEPIEELPLNSDWLKQYYDGNQNMQFMAEDNKNLENMFSGDFQNMQFFNDSIRRSESRDYRENLKT